jgi:FMN phosphatase YigB (HAD superfamily)
LSYEASNTADLLASDEETDRLALAAVESIKRLIAERNALRHEVTRLRDHVALIRNSYRRLANELVTQLQLVDSFDSEAQGTAGLVEFPRFLGKVPPRGPED